MSPTLDRRRALVSLAGLGAAGLASSRTAAAHTGDHTPTADQALLDGTTIVVTATGSASTPATHAIAQIIMRAQYDTAPPVKEESTPLPPTIPQVNPEDVQVVVAALVEQGVDQSMILTSGTETGFGGGYFGQGTAVIVFQLDGEQIKTLANLLTVATETVTSLGLMFDPPGAMYLSDTCQDLRADAYQDAIATGGEEAALIADAMGVEISGLRQARKQSISFGPAAYGYTASDACADLVNLGTAVRSYLPPFDPSLPNEFAVFAMVELTFATI